MDIDRMITAAFGEGRQTPPSEQERERARRLCMEGQQRNLDGQHLEALESFQESLRMDPGDSTAVGGLAWGLCAAGYGDKALQLLDAGDKFDPRNAELALCRGRCLKELGRLGEAVVAFDRALGLDPKSAAANYEAGLCQVEMGRDDLALGCFEAAVRLDCGHAACWNQKGDCLRRQGHLPEALTCVEKSLALDPAAPPPWYNKAQILEALGRGPEAGACYAKFVSMAPPHLSDMLFLARQKAAEFGANPP